MVTRTSRLQGSKQKRDDEYYTLFQDIADEVSLYLPQLRGKRILCPCDWDDPPLMRAAWACGVD